MSMITSLLPRIAARNTIVRSLSAWANVPQGPPDAILGLSVAFNEDPNPNKVSLGVGAFRDEQGKPYVLNCVREAEQRIHDKRVQHEYAPIGGTKQYTDLAAQLALGDAPAPLQEGRIASMQTISGTGALRVGGEFLGRFLNNGRGAKIYVPTPTWGNHHPIFKDSKVDIEQYPYFDPATNGLDFQGLLTSLNKAESGSAVLLHACAHNPTGVDPTREQWKEISDVVKSRGLVAFFDMAYQGFASGDPTADGWAVSHFIKEGHNVIITQSFAKNFGLYGERAGALHVVCDNPQEAEAVASQLKIVIRPMYSNPPLYGARLVEEILGDDALTKQWHQEIQYMSQRIIESRAQLKSGLAKVGSTRDWEHITSQIGMFCYTGLGKEQVERLKSEFSIYLTGDGRISIAGVNPGNVDYLAESFHKVTQ